jgi:hypothetical protein
MVVEPLAQPTQNIAMEIRSRHSETFRGGKNVVQVIRRPGLLSEEARH